MSAEPNMEPDPHEARQRSWFQDGTLETLEEASWAMRKLAKQRQALTEVEDLYEKERRRLDDWIAHERSRVGADAMRYELALTSYMRRRRMEDPECKTIELPKGRLVSRQLQDRIEVREPEVLVQWAEENGMRELVRVKREPARKPLADHVKSTGEVPPGVEVIPGDISFTVEVTDA